MAERDSGGGGVNARYVIVSSYSMEKMQVLVQEIVDEAASVTPCGPPVLRKSKEGTEWCQALMIVDRPPPRTRPRRSSGNRGR